MRYPCMFNLKEFLLHYKFTPLAWFLVKYRGHECNMILVLSPPPVVCGWRGYPVITAVGPFLSDLGCFGSNYQSLTLVGHWPLPVLFGHVPGGWSRQALCPVSSVLLGGLLRGWLVWCGCDVLLGTSFPNYLLHCNSWWSGVLWY